MQTSLMLATMAQRFRFSLKPGFKLKLLPTITLQPKHGISVIVQDRLPKDRGNFPLNCGAFEPLCWTR